MLGYSDTNVFTRDEKEMLSCAQRLMEVIEDDPNLRCHEVARAIGQVLHLPHQDGAYGFVEHTWLWTSPPRALDRLPHGWMMPNILDVYCVGSLPLVRLVYMVASGIGHRTRSALPTWRRAHRHRSHSCCANCRAASRGATRPIARLPEGAQSVKAFPPCHGHMKETGRPCPAPGRLTWNAQTYCGFHYPPRCDARKARIHRNVQAHQDAQIMEAVALAYGRPDAFGERKR